MERSIAKSNGTAIFSGSSAKQFSMHRDSHAIAKSKPKIRIIHIVAPKIINTDVENFRILVQRLTGKSDDAAGRAKSNGARGIIKVQPLRQEDRDQEHRIMESAAQTQRTKEVQFLFKGSDIGSAGTFGKFGDCVGIKFDQDLGQFGRQPFK